MQVIGVKFNLNSQVYSFDANGLTVHEDDTVIVETARGIEWGIVKSIKEQNKEDLKFELKPILRKATKDDLKKIEQNLSDAKNLIPSITEKIAELKVPMEVIDTEFTLDRDKFIIYFSAEERIEFKTIVTPIASLVKTRIELRQVNAREEVIMFGCVGSCGRECCCLSFNPNGSKTTMRMAKLQGLIPLPERMSGCCGKLMCCLAYENDDYEAIDAFMPQVGSKVETPDGVGYVLSVAHIKEEVTVRFQEDDIIKIEKYPMKDVKELKNNNQQEKHTDNNNTQHSTNNNHKEKNKPKKWFKNDVKQ